MWWGGSPDPGGSDNPGPSEEPSKQELTELKDQFEQQQVLIAQLKELLRKSDQSTTSIEKVEEYANTLSKIQTRVKKSKSRKSDTVGETSLKPKTDETKPDTPGKVKVDLLRKQLEENKAKLAQRGKSQKGIEEKVTQIKAQLDDPLFISHKTSTVEVTPLKTVSTETPAEELLNVISDKDKSINDLQSKIKKLEADLIDLQENLKEKDSVIDARTKAITLMSEDLSRKGKSTVDMLEETKEEMRAMQENFVTIETNMRNENQKLLQEVETQKGNVNGLNEQINILTGSLEMVKQENLSLKDEVGQKNDIIVQKNSIIEDLQKINEEINNVPIELKKRIETLEKENSSLVQQIKETEKPNSSLRSSKKRIGKLENENEKLKVQISDLQDKIKEMETVQTNIEVASSETEIKENERMRARISELERLIKENENESPEVEKLSKQLDDMNKNMIKTKAQNKAKIKELQKQVDAFKKISDVNSELVKLQNENEKLIQKIAEIEEEKGNLQLHVVEEGTNTETKITEFQTQIYEQSKRIDEYIETIRNLEQSKIDLQNDFETSKEKSSALEIQLNELVNIRNAQVCSDIESVQLEEQIVQTKSQIETLTTQLDTAIKENAVLLTKIENLNSEKIEMASKLENVIHENIELIDRLEKLSAEKVSSAESIEIVESLTQQEKMEIEEYNKKYADPDCLSGDELGGNSDLNDSITKLTEESAELMEKIELFTVERKEVMEKMDSLANENNELTKKLEQLQTEKTQLEETYEGLYDEKCKLEDELKQTKNELNSLVQDKEKLVSEIDVLNKKMDPGNVVTKSEKEDANTEIVNREIEHYKSLIEQQEAEINHLKEEIKINKPQLQELIKTIEEITKEKQTVENNLVEVTKERDEYNTRNRDLENNIENLNKDKNKLLIEYENLNEILTNNKEMIGKLNQDNISLSDSVSHYKNENDGLKSKLIENENDLFKSLETVQNLEIEVANSKSEIDHLNDIIEELQNGLANLEEKNKNVDDLSNLSTELLELKTIMSGNTEKLKQYEIEIMENVKTIEYLTCELNNMTKRVNETENVLYEKNLLVEKLEEEIVNKEMYINDLSNQVKEKEASFRNKIKNLQEKYQKLQLQIENTTGSIDEMKEPLETTISNLQEKCNGLEIKNKEQIEKMKKLAANLKKRVVMCNEFEQENQKLKASLTADADTRMQEKSTEYQKLYDEFTNTVEKLQVKVKEYENLIEDYKQQIDIINEQNSELQKKFSETVLKSDYDKLAKDLQNLHRTYDSEVQRFQEELRVKDNNLLAMNAKLTEQEMVIENIDQEKNNLRVKITQQSELINNLEDKYQEKENQIDAYGKDIENKKEMLEETNQAYRLLEERLKLTISQMESVQNQLQNTVAENKELLELNKSLNETVKNLQYRITQFDENINEMNNVAVEELQDENRKLHKVISEIDTAYKNIQHELNLQTEKSKKEIENLETQLSVHLEQLDNERMLLTQKCEYCENINDQLLQKQSIFEDNISALQIKLNEAERAYDEKLSENKLIIEDNSKLLTQLNLMQNKIVELEQLIAAKNDEINNLQLNSTNNETEQLQNAVSDFEVKYKHLLSEYNQLEAHLNTLSENKQQEPVLTQSYQTKNESSVSVQNIAETEVSNIIEKAENEVNNKRQSSESSHMDDVLGKIKTLQFMLYNADKLKDDALLQCQELTNEVTRLIYEREKLRWDKNEERVEKKEISQQALDFLESQIVTEEMSNLSSEPPVVEVNIPSGNVIEEPMVSKSAYVCFKPDDEILLETEDNFWGSEEAKLEDQHVQTSVDNTKITVLEEKINDLQIEKQRLSENLKSTEVKCAKLIKKLKEFKVLNDSMSAELNIKKASSDFGDLEKAIQDELAAQNKEMEKKLSEMKTETDKHSVEKENLLKRIDVLTAANERLTEMKERQDVEVEVWQTRNKELSNKLQQLEWGDDGAKVVTNIQPVGKPEIKSSDNSDLQIKINELNERINDLSIDNEELQCILEEQMQLRVAAEKKMAGVSEKEIEQLKEDYNCAVADKKKLIAMVDSLKEEKALLDNKYELLIQNQSKSDFDNEDVNNSLKHKIEDLENELLSRNKEKDLMEQKCDTLTKENNYIIENIINVLSSLNFVKKHVVNMINTNSISEENNKKEIQKLLLNLQEKEKEIFDLNDLVSKQHEKIEELMKENSDKVSSSAIEENQKIVEELESKLLELQAQIISERNDLDLKLTSTIEQCSLAIEQRGADIAQSWKQHLEMREGEFSQIENKLKQDFVDLETKYNTLVTDISNSESQYSQILLEKQSLTDKINQLSKELNEKVNELQQSNNTLYNKNSENETLNSILQAKTLEFESIMHDYNNIKDTVSNQNTELQKYASIIDSKDNQVDYLTKEIEHYKNKIFECQTEIDNLSALLQQKEEGIEVLKRKEEAYEKMLNDQTEKINTDQNWHKNTIKDYEDKLSEKESTIEILNVQLQELDNKYEIDFKQKEYDVIRLKDECDSLEAKLKNQCEESGSFNLILKQKDEEIRVLHEQLQLNATTYNNLLEQNSEFSKTIDDFKSKEKQINDEIKYLREQLDLKAVECNDFIEKLNEYSQAKILIENLQNRLSQNTDIIDIRDNDLSNLKIQLDQKIKENEELQFEIERLSEKSNESADLRNDLENMTIQYEMKNNECDNLRKEIQQQSEKFNESIKLHEELSNLRTQHDMTIAECENLRFEIQQLNETIVINYNDFESSKKQLELKVNECEALKKEIDGLNSILTDMKQLTESQSLRMSQSGKISEEIIQKRRTQFGSDEHTENQRPEISDNPNDLISRAELDFALYMLHQRDVRCEELTVELTQLLEERDTLQLRLSNVIRVNEDLKCKDSPNKSRISLLGATPEKSSRPSKSSEILLGAAGAELAKEATEENTTIPSDLKSKLSQLHPVDYRRDVRFRDDQEARHLQQMSILQQHHDMAALLPSEAAARLVDANNYTLSRDVQSPSTVLLNWLWGRDTPKVNHI